MAWQVHQNFASAYQTKQGSKFQDPANLARYLSQLLCMQWSISGKLSHPNPLRVPYSFFVLQTKYHLEEAFPERSYSFNIKWGVSLVPAASLSLNRLLKLWKFLLHCDTEPCSGGLAQCFVSSSSFVILSCMNDVLKELSLKCCIIPLCGKNTYKILKKSLQN